MAVPISCNTVDFMNAETSNLRVPTITSTMDSGTERQLAFYPSGGYLCVHHNGGWVPANSFEFKVSGSGLNWDGTTLSLDSSAFLVRKYDSTAEYGQQYYYDFNSAVVKKMRIAKDTTGSIFELGELYLDENRYLRIGDSTGNRAVEITDTGFGLEKTQDGVLNLLISTGLAFKDGGYRELYVDTDALGLESKYLSLSGGGTVMGTTLFNGSTQFNGQTIIAGATTFSGVNNFTTSPTFGVGFSTYVGSEITLGDDSSVTLAGSTDSSRGGITLTGTANLNTASGVLTLPTGDNASTHQTGMVYFTDNADSPTLQIYSAIQGKWVEVGGSSSGDYLPLSGGTLTGDLLIQQDGRVASFKKGSIVIGTTPSAAPAIHSHSYVYIGRSTTLNYTSHVLIGTSALIGASSNVIIGNTTSSSGSTEVSIGDIDNDTTTLSYVGTTVSIGHISASSTVSASSQLKTAVSIGQVDATTGASSTVTFGGGPCKVSFGSGAVFIVPVGLSTYFTALEGQIYFNSTDKKFYGYNGTEWKAFAYES